MKTLFFYCSDTETLEILNKYSDEGLSFQDGEYKGYLKFSDKEHFLNFLGETQKLSGFSTDESSWFDDSSESIESSVDGVPFSWIDNSEFFMNHPLSG